MAIKYPIDCITPEERLGYLQTVKELIKKLHNGMNVWQRDGISLSQHTSLFENDLSGIIKSQYPHTLKISKSDWDDFNKNMLEKLNAEYIAALGPARKACNESKRWPIDLGAII